MADELATPPGFGSALSASETPIPGLLVFELPVHGDSRGWFKENWQRETMVAAGLPDFGPVQQNISFNDAAGTVRGVHAEPWDKWVSVATGRAFGAWVDLRDGATFGRVFTTELDASRAIFVPRGVGNAFQTLEPGTTYSYLVNDHWSPDAVYTALHPGDETAAITWPIPLAAAEVSAKDLQSPRLADVVPIPPRKTLVLGSGGQLSRALQAELGDAPHLEFVDRDDIDLSAPGIDDARRWRDYDVIINAAGFTAVDLAESAAGRREAWTVNVSGLAALARIAAEHRITIVHISSDYVFDGSLHRPYREDDELCPLGVYGQTKAAGDAVVATVPRHYIVRTSWVIGDGRNFVRTMATFARGDVDPAVVDDQVGRLTFAPDLARGIRHLLESASPYGTYNLTGSGEPASWAQVATRVFGVLGANPGRVRSVSTAQYAAAAAGMVAPRPANSVLDLTKIVATGWTPRDHLVVLDDYAVRLSS